MWCIPVNLSWVRQEYVCQTDRILRQDLYNPYLPLNTVVSVNCRVKIPTYLAPLWKVKIFLKLSFSIKRSLHEYDREVTYLQRKCQWQYSERQARFLTHAPARPDRLGPSYIWPLLSFLISYSDRFYLLIVSVEGYCCTRSHSMTHTHTTYTK